MNPFQKLLQSIGASGITRASGVVNNLGTPIRKSLEDIPANLSILKDLITRGRPTSVVDNLGTPVEKSIGSIRDILSDKRVRPSAQAYSNRTLPGNFDVAPSRTSFTSAGQITTPTIGYYKLEYDDPTQQFLREYRNNISSTSRGGLFDRLNSMVTGKPFLSDLPESGSKLSSGVANTAASLKPTSVSTAFPFDDPLALLKGQARYVQRQVQGGIGQGIGQVGNLYKKLQGVGPTAINPLATKTPATFLGKAGQVINPLNPTNLAGFATAGLINQFVPENGPLKGNLELLAGIPGGPVPKILGTALFAATPLGMSDKQETALSQIGRNYIVNGIQYDYKTGRAINPPTNTFIPDRSAAPPDNSGFIQDNNIDNRRFENAPSPRNTEAERRAYLSELSSVAQQTAQNPLLNQYNALRKPDPRAAEDLGMQIFALANPELAKKVTPGQAGYDVIQRIYPQATTAATELTEEERQAIANQVFYNQY